MGNMVFWSGVLPIYILSLTACQMELMVNMTFWREKYNSDLESLDECVNTLSWSNISYYVAIR